MDGNHKCVVAFPDNVVVQLTKDVAVPVFHAFSMCDF